MPILLSSGAMVRIDQQLSYQFICVSFLKLQCVVSIQRINNYINGDEIDENAVIRDETVRIPVQIQDATFSWSKDSAPALKDISMRIKRNQLVAIVGQVGSGKSSLLYAILGEMEKMKGTVATNGTIAYVPQQAWIQNKSLRENILFVNEYNERRYKKVIDCCALTEDLKVLSAEDMTEIGEKGINLSGGQKQRVSLARAVYFDADIYLLDDPLSAVDTHVGRHLFQRVIGPNGILKDKTRILVTHRVSFLPSVNQIIVIKDGFVSESGTFDELIDRRGDFAEFVAEYLLEQSDSDLENGEIDVIQRLRHQMKPIMDKTVDRSIRDSLASGSSGGLRRRTFSKRSSSVVSSRSGKSMNSEGQLLEKPIQKTNGKLTEAETSETGSVKLQIYKCYISLFGLAFNVTIMGSFIVANVSQILAGLWLSEWANDSLDQKNLYNTSLRDLRLGVYAGIGIFESIFSIVANLSASLGCIRAAKLLHNRMIERVIKAPMTFFGKICISCYYHSYYRRILKQTRHPSGEY